MVNSKAKGSQFEREVCKALSLWVTHGQREDVFWRSAMSGGRATVAHKKGQSNRQAGDICAVAPEGHALLANFYIECKHVKSLDLDSFFVKNTGALAKFWEVAYRGASLSGARTPMIVAKQNGWPILVFSLIPSTTRLMAGRGVEVFFFTDMLREDPSLYEKPR